MLEEVLKTLIDSSRAENYMSLAKVRSFQNIVLNIDEVSEIEANTEADVPRWLAYELSKSGLAELSSEERVTVEELARLAFLETKTISTASSLQKLSPDFYVKVKHEIELTMQQLSKSPTSEIIEKYRKTEMFVRDIVRSRLRKILNLVLTVEEPKDIISKFAPEEKILYRILRDIIKLWVEETTGLKY